MGSSGRYSVQPWMQFGDFRISAIARQRILYTHGRTGAGIIGEKQPVAIIIVTATGSEILDLDGSKFPAEKAIQLCPEIAEFLDPETDPGSVG